MINIVESYEGNTLSSCIFIWRTGHHLNHNERRQPWRSCAYIVVAGVVLTNASPLSRTFSFTALQIPQKEETATSSSIKGKPQRSDRKLANINKYV